MDSRFFSIMSFPRFNKKHFFGFCNDGIERYKALKITITIVLDEIKYLDLFYPLHINIGR